MRLKQAREPVPLIPVRSQSDLPAVLADAKLWLDAENIDGEEMLTLENGDPILEWKDLSGNGNDVVQTNNSFSPTFKQISDISNKPGIEFSSNFLTLSESNSFENWSKYTKIVVYETNQVSTAQVIIDIHWKNSSDIDVGP